MFNLKEIQIMPKIVKPIIVLFVLFTFNFSASYYGYQAQESAKVRN